MINTLIKRLLALRIRYPERPKTKGDILRYAFYVYLRGDYDGLCHSILYAIKKYHWYYKYLGVVNNIQDISILFPLFNKRIAICIFKGRDDRYWWPINDYKHRYRYMKWLIKQYDNEKL